MHVREPSVFEVGFAQPLPLPAAEVVGRLAPFVTPARLERIASIARGRTLAVTPVLENLLDPHNASAILRSADAFGVHRVHVVADRHRLTAVHKVAKGSQRWLELVRHASPERCIEALRAEGRTVFVAAMDGEHRPEDLAGRPRVAVVFGNERHGASAAMREAADGAFAIPMQGFVESLNVSVAAAITLYTLGRDAPSRATADEQLAIVARLLLNTVNDATKIVSEPEAM